MPPVSTRVIALCAADLAATDAAADEMVGEGVVAVVSRNLRRPGGQGGAAAATSADAADSGAAGGEDADDDDAAAAPATKASGDAGGSWLVASSLYLVASLCAAERHIAAGAA